MKFNLNQAVQNLLYICEYLLENGQRRSFLLRPVDATNGVILGNTDNSDRMYGLTSTGRQVELPIDRILRIERYRVGFNDMGSGHKTRNMSESKVEEAIRNRTNKETGEITGITNFEDKKDKNNRYNRND